MARKSSVPSDKPGQVLEKRRKELNLSRADVEKIARIKPSVYSRFIHARARSREVAEKIIFALGLKYEQVFGDEQAPVEVELIPADMGKNIIPLRGYADAGEFTEIVDLYQPGDAEEWLFTDIYFSKNTFALEIRGESMLPDFVPGDRVIIDPEVPPGPGDFVVAKNGGRETFKYKSRGCDKDGQPIFARLFHSISPLVVR